MYHRGMATDRDLHQLVDQLTPGQAAAIRAVIAQFPVEEPRAAEGERRLAIAGKVNGPADLAARADDIVRTRFRRS